MRIIGNRPGRAIISFFLFTIFAGSLLLALPISSARQPIAYIDALFTSTSAVCVTGLIVLDTPVDFSLFGQIVILLLIQLGGLGILTLGTLILFKLVPTPSLQFQMDISKSVASHRTIKSGSLFKTVLFTTLLFEGFGALLLFFGFLKYYSPGRAAYHAIFHSVSAFCNAGFLTFSTSLESFKADIYIISVFALLIICGGIGFVVIHEIWLRIRYRNVRFSLHARICILVTFILLILGTFIFIMVEDQNAYKALDFPVNVFNALFQSVTARTAGFNTVGQESLNEISLLVTMILMFIGACPGSTGGGIKTTTMAVLIIQGWNRIRGRAHARIFNRTLGVDSINRSVTIAMSSIFVIVLMFALLMFAEEKPLPHVLTHGWFIDTAFESISAFGTVGLSLGITETLHTFGKLLTIILMFVGRVGLLTVVYALSRPLDKAELIYVKEDVMVG